MKETNTYQEALKQYQRAKKKADKAQEVLNQAKNQMEEARKDLVIACDCGSKYPVKDIAFLEETIPGYSSDDWDWYTHDSWICPACGEEWGDMKNEIFPEGIKKYCKKVYAWQGFEPKEVSDLRLPRRTRMKEEEEAKNHLKKIEEAKNLLIKEGILQHQ